MTRYIAFLRGINVGGNNIVKMADLQRALSDADFHDVKTYIQSGNVIFSSKSHAKEKLADTIKATILDTFQVRSDVVIFSEDEWRDIIKAAPSWWGSDTTWKHNILIMVGPHTMSDVVAAIGALKPDIEALQPGNGVLYQSMSFASFGRTTAGKLAANPIYKKMTIRNFNTATKLLSFMEK